MSIPNIDPPPTYPYGFKAPGSGIVAQTAQLSLPQTTTKTIFSVTGGPIRVTEIFGIVTTAIGAVANATKLSFVPSTNWVPAAPTVDICATADINALAKGALYLPITSFATAAQISATSGIGPVANASVLSTFVMVPGTIIVNCAGSDGGTGRIMWVLRYIPLSLGPIGADTSAGIAIGPPNDTAGVRVTSPLS